MKSIHYIIYMALAALSFTACQEEDFGSGAKGGIRISLTEASEVEVSTKSTPTELWDDVKEKFKIKVTGTDYNETFDYTDELIPLEEGTYDVEATCGEDVVLALDAPYFVGKTEDIKVSSGEKNVSIECAVANALVTVKFEELDKSLEEAYVALAINDADPINNMNQHDKSFYFKAGSSITSLILYKDNEGGNNKVDLLDEAKKALGDKFPNTFAAGDHLIITLSSNGKLSLDVSVKVEKSTIEETIPMEWLPKPSVSATGFDSNNSLTFAETETKNAKLDLKLASALQDIKFKFDFQDEQFSFEDREYLLSTDKEAIEQALDITLPTIGATDASIDFAGLVAKLQSKAEGATTNKIMIVPKANDRWSSEKTEVDSVYTFTCNKPEFSIAVQPGNVWTKTFTIDEPTVTAGNLETIKGKLKYQYKTENGEWQDCNQSVQFKTAPDEKNYQVRAIYRDVIASKEVAVTLETPTQLSNSDMEEWNTSSDDTGWGGFTYYTFYPHLSEESDIWWTTNNQRSQEGVKAGGLSYRGSFSPCVSYSETEKHKNSRSALIYTSGHGGHYSSTSFKMYPESAFAGSLFIGTYNWNRDNDPMETITTGHAFSSRPTGFKFWYKYVPKNSDAFKVYIELKNGDEIVASGTFVPETISSETGWIAKSIDLDYGDSPKAATSIYVQFLSTTKTSFAESDFDKNKSITFPVMGDWNAHIGSMLYIDDLSLIYDK